MMKRLAISLSTGALAGLVAVAAVSAADPTPTPGAADPAATPAPVATPAPAANPPVIRGPDTGTISGILGLSQEEIDQLRAQGQTLAQIATSQGIDPQRMIDALVGVWGARIDARAAVGALSADQAAALKANLEVQAKAMVNQATLGGMRGGAVGAGPGAMGGRGAANGYGGGMGRWGTDDAATQPRGMGRWGTDDAATQPRGMGRWGTDDAAAQPRGMGRWGTGGGAGTCPMTSDESTAS